MQTDVWSDLELIDTQSLEPHWSTKVKNFGTQAHVIEIETVGIDKTYVQVSDKIDYPIVVHGRIGDREYGCFDKLLGKYWLSTAEQTLVDDYNGYPKGLIYSTNDEINKRMYTGDITTHASYIRYFKTRFSEQLLQVVVPPRSSNTFADMQNEVLVAKEKYIVINVRRTWAESENFVFRIHKERNYLITGDFVRNGRSVDFTLKIQDEVNNTVLYEKTHILKRCIFDKDNMTFEDSKTVMTVGTLEYFDGKIEADLSKLEGTIGSLFEHHGIRNVDIKTEEQVYVTFPKDVPLADTVFSQGSTGLRTIAIEQNGTDFSVSVYNGLALENRIPLITTPDYNGEDLTGRPFAIETLYIKEEPKGVKGTIGSLEKGYGVTGVEVGEEEYVQINFPEYIQLESLRIYDLRFNTFDFEIVKTDWNYELKVSSNGSLWLTMAFVPKAGYEEQDYTGLPFYVELPTFTLEIDLNGPSTSGQKMTINNIPPKEGKSSLFWELPQFKEAVLTGVPQYEGYKYAGISPSADGSGYDPNLPRLENIGDKIFMNEDKGGYAQWEKDYDYGRPEEPEEPVEPERPE